MEVNKKQYVIMFKMINSFIQLFENIDVTNFDISEITFYGTDEDVEEYFSRFPEFNKFNDCSIHCGEEFAYKFI